MKLTSSPSRNSSITTRSPAAPIARSTRIVSTARWASSALIATITPFPAASPSAFTTMGVPLASIWARAAHAHIDASGTPIVVKADGLAAGKGVIVAMSADEAHRAVETILVERAMGAAGDRVVIEEFLEGEEVSFIVLADGEHVLPLATSQDHKRLRDGDKGPNTGGMGAYSPAPVVAPGLHARVVREIIQPVLAGMTEEGHRYSGFLYAGLMIDASGNPRVLEFNCR